MREREQKVLSMWVQPELKERLDRVAKKAGLSRNQMIVNLLTISLDEAEAMQAVGLLQAAVWVRELKDKIGKSLTAAKIDAANAVVNGL